MSSVKISQLDPSANINANPSQSLFITTDLDTNQTTSLSARALGDSLYSNNSLVVGSGGVVLPNVVAQYTGIGGSYVQISAQNLNSNGSVDYVLTADTGTDTSSFLDLGLNNSTFDVLEFGSMKALDGYLFVQGPTPTSTQGNLVIGTASSGANIVFAVGGTTATNIVGRITTGGQEIYRGLKVEGNIRIAAEGNLIFSDGTTMSTAGASNAYSVAAFNAANSVNTYAHSTNTWLQSFATNYTDSANLFLRNADVDVLNAAEAYTDAANTYIKGHFLANTTGTFAGDLSVTGAIKVGAGTIDYLESASPATFLVSSNNSLTLGANGNFVSIETDGSVLFPSNVTISGNSQVESINTANLSVVGTANVSGTLNVVGVVSMNAQLVMSNVKYSNTESALTISASPTIATPAADGYMIHISGKNGVPSKIVTDSYGTGSYSVYASRTARGTVDAPSAVQAGDIIGRFSGGGYGTTKFQTLGTGRIDFVAAENFTDSNTGSQITFWNCPIGSNTLTNIATFNGSSAVFSGVVNPQKGFIYTPRLPAGAQTAITIDYSTDSMVKANCAADITFSHTNFMSGKVVEVWLTNTSGTNRTVTHGCSAINSTTNSTTFTIPSTSSAYMKFFSIDGDLANTFVTVNHA